MQQVLFIGWWNVYRNREDFIEQLKTWDNNPFEVKKKWKYSLAMELWDEYQVAMIDMPNKNIASYIRMENTVWKDISILRLRSDYYCSFTLNYIYT